MNALTAPSDILAGAAPKWQARDDVYQVGQLLGDAGQGRRRGRGSARRTSARLPCSDHLKEIVYRCIGERRKRYESADELIDALRTPPAALKAGVLRTLKGVHLAFTGILSRPRARGVARRDARRRHRPRRPVGADDGRRARPAQPAAGGRPRRRAEADGDQAAAREGPPHHAAQRSAVLAPGRKRAEPRFSRADELRVCQGAASGEGRSVKSFPGTGSMSHRTRLFGPLTGFFLICCALATARAQPRRSSCARATPSCSSATRSPSGCSTSTTSKRC